MWRLILLISIVMNLCVAETLNNDVDPVVCFGMGCVRGKSFKGYNKEFEGFLGIPFAAPPVGELRLRDPQPIIERWPQIMNVTEEKMYCMQKNYLMPNPTVSGVEDCLYLYVYRPKISIRRRRKLLPVIVYIHGGGFFAGMAGPSVSGADYFMDIGNVIFVTMSYRLGPLGFLSTGDINMSGNFGLKDQALAIKWVKDNIKEFGGDENNIVLMGQSAGSSSAHLHMMSPLTRNLISKVVLVSGNANGPYAYVIQDPLYQARKFAEASGIREAETMKSNQLAKKLRNADAEKIIDACDSLKVWDVDPLTISRPVVEDCNEVDGFLCADPVDMWQSGDFAKVPILTGFMNGDGGVRALAIMANKTLLNDLNRNFDLLIPKLMEIEDKSPKTTAENLRKIKNRYFEGSAVTNETAENLVKLYTERSFIAPLYNTLHQLVHLDGKTPAYVYKFSFQGPLSYSFLYTGNMKNYGPVHCDELIYLLKSPAIFPEFDKNSQEAKFRMKFVKFFTDFANDEKALKCNRNVAQKCVLAVNRQPHASLKCKFIEFDNNGTSEGELDAEIANFWNAIDPTMIRRKRPQIEVKQISNTNFHQNLS